MISSSSSRANQELNTSSPMAARSRTRTPLEQFAVAAHGRPGHIHGRRPSRSLSVLRFAEFIARTARTSRHCLPRSPTGALFGLSRYAVLPAPKADKIPTRRGKRRDWPHSLLLLTPGTRRPAGHYLSRTRKTIILTPRHTATQMDLPKLPSRSQLRGRGISYYATTSVVRKTGGRTAVPHPTKTILVGWILPRNRLFSQKRG